MLINGKDVSRETADRLDLFVTLFQKWAKSINLVSPATLPDVWQRHVADSAQIFQLSPRPQHWVDLGSGGGFPGVITAILLREAGSGHVDLIESNQKKAAFLRQALRETDAAGEVHVLRIEDAPSVVASADAISARALADLDQLFVYAEPWMTKNASAKAYFHKGRDYHQETIKADGRWTYDLVKHASAVEPDSVILEISALRRKAI